ncbi:gastrula zinc finger protein XlCGF8.2DB-like [Physella acuta]|uniref:gastrula zinc finger protein XlCGF8.2DB-like n=1 Tax=Physella acuta TaxID=109671 RepID=UPI0027DC2A19|nr:gastrula zinc finger protein XlCGF8.2DB-like [Physella acuta]
MYPSLFFPVCEDFKFFNISQLQAANQVHLQAASQTQLARELATLKPTFLSRNLELAMLVCSTFRGKLFPCPHCRYVTDRRNNLKRHISTMHQACDKQLECCGVTFATKASLRDHIAIFHHNGYSCPFCGRRFCRKALLKRHLSVHSGQKDYTCPSCDYATSHKSNLERHKRIHARLQIMSPGGSTEDLVDEMSAEERLGKNLVSRAATAADQGDDKMFLSTWHGHSSLSPTDDLEDYEVDIDDNISHGVAVGSVNDVTNNNINLVTDETNDPINLVTECNARATGKMASRLSHGITGQPKSLFDPHDPYDHHIIPA